MSAASPSFLTWQRGSRVGYFVRSQAGCLDAVLTLYDYLDSGNGYKIRLLLALLNHPYRWVELDIMTGATRVPEFLATLRRNGKRLVLFTNAHPETLAIKDERTGVSGYLDAMFSAHTFSWPKEDARFWASIRRTEPFDPGRTLFVDDSPPVLAAARAAGIRWVFGVRHPDSQGTVRDHGPWPAVDRITDLAGPDSGLVQ